MASGKLAMGVVLGLLVFSLVQPAHSQFARHHIGLGLGYFKALSSDLRQDALGIDLTNGMLVDLNYRFSFNNVVDLAVDNRLWFSSQSIGEASLTLMTSFFGIGVRLNSPGKVLRSYIQPNLYMANEEVTGEYGGWELVSKSESTIGFGINGGVDITLSNLISIPVEACFLLAEPADNVSGFGFASGINFNFGRVKPKEEL